MDLSERKSIEWEAQASVTTIKVETDVFKQGISRSI